MLRTFRGPSAGALLALLTLGWGSNQFAPLIVMYQSQLGVSAAQAQAMFVLYAVGLVPGLFLGGRWSDRRGRAQIVRAALLLAGLSSIVLMCGSAAHPLLYLGRLLAGAASGVGFSAGTAWAKETTTGDHAARRSVVAMTAGFAGGPMIVGLVAAALVAATVPRLAVWVYVPHLLLVAWAVWTLRRAPTGGPVIREPASGQRAAGRGGHDVRFARIVVPLAPWVFITASVALAILPGATHPGTALDLLAFTAVVTALPAVAGVVIQPLMARLHGLLTPLLAISMSLAVVGLLLGAEAVAAQSLTMTALACIVLGLSYGACQTCGLHEVMAASPPQALGHNTAIYQALTYLGDFTPLPIVLLSTYVPLVWILTGIALAAGATLAWLVVANLRIDASARIDANLRIEAAA
jgi:MFS family permease